MRKNSELECITLVMSSNFCKILPEMIKHESTWNMTKILEDLPFSTFTTLISDVEWTRVFRLLRAEI